MLMKCLLAALVYSLGNMDVRYFGAHRWNWPIFLSAVIGMVCGDLRTGIIMGVELQLIFLGFVAIGMSTLPDGAAGTTIAVYFVVVSGMDSATAIALAMPVALLFQPLQIFKNVTLNFFNIRSDVYCEKADYRGVERCLRLANLLQGIFDFVLMFVVLYAGGAAVEGLVNHLPVMLMNCLNKTAQILPALGIAYLMNYVTDRFTMPFILLGFGLSAFFGLGSLAVSLFGAVIALVYFNVKSMNSIEGDRS